FRGLASATEPASALTLPFAGSPRPPRWPRLSRSRLQARLVHRAGLGSHALVCRLASSTALASALTLSFAGSPRPPRWPRLSRSHLQARLGHRAGLGSHFHAHTGCSKWSTRVGRPCTTTSRIW